MDRRTRPAAQAAAGSGTGENPSASWQISVVQLRQFTVQKQCQDNLDRAVKLYPTSLQLNSADVGVWCNLGAVLRKQKHYQSTINCYGHALGLRLADTARLGNLANALKEQHRPDESIAILRQLIKQEHGEIPAWIARPLAQGRSSASTVSTPPCCVLPSAIFYPQIFLKNLVGSSGELVGGK